MKLSDNPPQVIDEIITEVRAVKRAISERYENDIDRLLESLINQEKSMLATHAKQSGEDSEK